MAAASSSKASPLATLITKQQPQKKQKAHETPRPEPDKVLDRLEDSNHEVVKVNWYGRTYDRWLGLRRDVLIQYRSTSKAIKRLPYHAIQGVLVSGGNQLVIYRNNTDIQWKFVTPKAILLALQISARMRLHRDNLHWQTVEQYIQSASTRYRTNPERIMNNASMRLLRSWFSYNQVVIIHNLLVEQSTSGNIGTAFDNSERISLEAEHLQKLTGYSEAQRVWQQVHYILFEGENEASQLLARILQLLRKVLNKCKVAKKYEEVLKRRSNKKSSRETQTFMYVSSSDQKQSTDTPQQHLERLLGRVNQAFEKNQQQKTTKMSLINGAPIYSRCNKLKPPKNRYHVELAPSKSSLNAVLLQTAALERFLTEGKTGESVSSHSMRNLLERGYSRRMMMSAGRRWSVAGESLLLDIIALPAASRAPVSSAKGQLQSSSGNHAETRFEDEATPMKNNPIMQQEPDDIVHDMTYGAKSKTPLDYFRQCVDKLHESILENQGPLLEILQIDLPTYRKDEGESNIHGSHDAVEETVSSIVMRVCEQAIYLPLRQDLLKCIDISLEYRKEIEVKKALNRLRYSTQDTFGIPGAIQSPDGWAAATMEIRRAEMETLPHQKLSWFVGAPRTIHVLHRMYTTNKGEKYFPLGADEFFPIFCYVIARANLERPVFFQDLLWSACDNQMLRGESGYYLTTYEAALQNFIETAKRLP